MTNLRKVRVVTTNFDNLFEKAASSQFNLQPKLFQSPALPLGNRFRGIVHLHGSVDEPEQMVLTARDFGRAYLTESDGWARRFLIDLFSNYTVLFVGYSHSDTIMTYLTPSLPPADDQKRFTLVGNRSSDLNHWRRMGIEPITFPQADSNDFSGLDTTVIGLAAFLRRGLLDWQREITTIASGRPPFDDESVAIIQHALTDPVMTRFFVKSAESPKWIEWLDLRDHLTDLFTDGELNARDELLAWWLASNFALPHDYELFKLIRRRGPRMSLLFWSQLVRQLKFNISQSPDASVLTRWSLYLTSVIPTNADETEISWLADVCASVEATDSLLRLYEVITARINQIMPIISRQESTDFNYTMQKMLSEVIKPSLADIAHPLLTLITNRIKERHTILSAWRRDNLTTDLESYIRSAIEPHEQNNRNDRAIDAMIDTARECLEWLANNAPSVVAAWCDSFVDSDAPLLRRLAVHAIAARNDFTGDDKIVWLLERCDLNETEAHHEIFRLAAHAYPRANSEHKEAFIQKISEFQLPDSQDYDSDLLSASQHFNWFHWLHQSDPDCSIAKDALDDVLTRHPEFEPQEYPDLTHWARTSGTISPWSSDSLLASPPSEILLDLLEYQPTDRQRFEGYGRSAILMAINRAAQTSPSWGLDLADAMVEIGEWDSDIWYHVITSWKTSKLSIHDMKRVLDHLSATKLHPKYALEIAAVLTELLRRTDRSETIEILNKANSIATALRQYTTISNLPRHQAFLGGVPQYVSWHNKAINHASGHLALFWIHSVELWRKQQKITPQSLSVEYQDALNVIITEQGELGKFGRAILASNFQFLFAVDENWTVKNLLPIFDVEHEDFRCVWDGFLTWGQLSLPIAELLRESMFNGVSVVAKEFQGELLDRFVELYVAALSWLIKDATDIWITKFFKHVNAEMKNQFASQICRRLDLLAEGSQQEWWSVWLKDYWENRLQGVPVPLSDAETALMIDWVFRLPGVFPDAVSTATQMSSMPLERLWGLHKIAESDLIGRYPSKLARLLIYLGQCDTKPWFWHGTREAIDKLLAKDLAPDLERGLCELIAKHGHLMNG